MRIEQTTSKIPLQALFPGRKQAPARPGGGGGGHQEAFNMLMTPCYLDAWELRVLIAQRNRGEKAQDVVPEVQQVSEMV